LLFFHGYLEALYKDVTKIDCALNVSVIVFYRTLWGEHATSFEDQFLIETIGNDEAIVIIFAGVQARLFLGGANSW
jgi:hypothetical protein